MNKNRENLGDSSLPFSKSEGRKLVPALTGPTRTRTSNYLCIYLTALLFSNREKETPEDHGVLTWKRALKLNIEKRFQDIETNMHYTAATLLDSRYKHYMFRNAETFTATKQFLVDKLIESMGGGSGNSTRVRKNHFVRVYATL